jgi:hypothetical protein
VINAGDLDVISWTFSGGGTTVAGPRGITQWGGTAAASGEVSVRLADGRTLVGAMTVLDRGWTWATHAVSEYRDGTGVRCLNHTPTLGVDGYNLPLAATNCQDGRRMVQPDSYSADGFVATTVPSGPNKGMHYVSSASLSIRRESTYNSGLFPDAPRVPLVETNLYPHQSRCGRATANWYEFSTCMNAHPDAFIAGVRAHEGYGTTGHNGHFSAAYDAVANPANDPMILFDQIVGEPTMTFAAFVQRVRTQFYQVADQADRATLDIQDGGFLVTGNWTGQTWRWLPLEGRFTLSALSSI